MGRLDLRVEIQNQSRLVTTREGDEGGGIRMKELSCAGEEADVPWRRHASEAGLEI
jgi:hypothetical protein